MWRTFGRTWTQLCVSADRSTAGATATSTESRPVEVDRDSKRGDLVGFPDSGRTITSSIWRRIRMAIAALAAVGSPTVPKSRRWARRCKRLPRGHSQADPAGKAAPAISQCGSVPGCGSASGKLCAPSAGGAGVAAAGVATGLALAGEAFAPAAAAGDKPAAIAEIGRASCRERV